MRAILTAALAVSLAGCVLGEVDLTGRACPCVDGFVCDPADNICRPSSAVPRDAGFEDGGVEGDASTDAGRDAGFDDGGAPRDAGPTRDGGPYDAGPYPECQVDVDCGPGTICTSDVCVPACDQTGGATCSAPEACVDGRCLELGATCTASTECGDGPPFATCVAGACALGCGATSNACDGNRVCSAAGFCDVAPRCTVSSDCGHPDLYCLDGSCTRRCDRPGGLACYGDSTCDINGRCSGANPIGGACEDNAECSSEFCLALVAPTMDVYCTRPCAATSDCPFGYTCLRVSGAKQCVREESLTGGAMLDTPSGGMCTAEVNTCQSLLCSNTDRCVERCSSDADCAAFGTSCVTLELASGNGTTFLQVCLTSNGFATGASCGNNGQCASGICNRYVSACQIPCCSHADCDTDEICTVYDIESQTPATVCQAATTQGGAFGASCNAGSECASGLCVPTDPEDLAGPKACTTYCCTDSDCGLLPNGGRCATFNGPIMGAQTKVCVPR